MLPPFFVYLVVDPAVVGVRVGVSLEMSKNWVEFLLDAFHCPDLPHGYPTPASPLRFRPARLALRGRAQHLVRAGLPAHLQRQGHIVTAIHIIEDDPAYPPAEIRTAFELARRLATTVRSARIAGHFPLVLSGNCNTAVGTLSGLTPARRATFWFDAHGDCNTPETTTSGFLDGMGLAMTMGLCWHHLGATVPGFQPVAAEATFLLGARDLDPPEAALLQGSAITAVPVGQIPEGSRASWRGRRWRIPSAISTWTSMCWIRPSATRTTCRPPTASPFPT